MCTGPGLPVVATRKALRTTSGTLEGSVTVKVSLVTPVNMLVWSNPVSMLRFSRWSGMSLVNTIMGKLPL